MVGVLIGGRGDVTFQPARNNWQFPPLAPHGHDSASARTLGSRPWFGDPSAEVRSGEFGLRDSALCIHNSQLGQTLPEQRTHMNQAVLLGIVRHVLTTVGA